MTYIEGDIVTPKELIIPVDTVAMTNAPVMTKSGAKLFLSGQKLFFAVGTGVLEQITSA